jgi:hypothetical protein
MFVKSLCFVQGTITEAFVRSLGREFAGHQKGKSLDNLLSEAQFLALAIVRLTAS